MTLISKAAGAFSLISSLKEIHNNALIYSKREVAKASADTFIATSLSTQRTNRMSTKDTARKKWLSRNNFLVAPSETLASIRGYVSGAWDGLCGYLPNIIISGLALGLNKNHKVLANLCAVALGIIEGVDFINNSVGSNQKNDYLKL